MAERSFPAPAVAVYGGSRIIASPFQFATTDDDNLQIVSANSLAGVVLTIQGRRLTPAGTIEVFSHTHIPNSDRSTRVENYKLGGGALLNLVIFASTGSPKIGQTYVSARMIRGLSAATILLGALLGGYVTAAQPLAYPGSPIENSISTGGVLRYITGTNPAAGVEITETVPTGARWEVIAVKARFVASGVAASRRPRLGLSDAAPNAATILPAAGPTTAGVATIYLWTQGVPWAVNGTLDVNGPLPQNVTLLAGTQVFTVTDGLQAGDDYDAPILTVREWLEVQA